MDEAEDFGGGPYLTEKVAIEELNKYGAWLNGEVNNEFERTLSENVGDNYTGNSRDSCEKI